MPGYINLVAKNLITASFLVWALAGCNWGQSPEQKAKTILNNYSDQMIACYADSTQSNNNKCRDELIDKIYADNTMSGIPKKVFEKVLRTWESRCKNRTEKKRYAIYVLEVRGTNNPLEDKIIENLETQGFNAGYLECDNVEAIADKFSVSPDQLEGKDVAFLYHQDATSYITEKIKKCLEDMPEIPAVKMTRKGNAYMYSFGIYVPAG